MTDDHIRGRTPQVVFACVRNGGRSVASRVLTEHYGGGRVVALIFALARTGRAALAAPAVGAYIGAAYWFTSSTSFANPAVTIGRVFSDTFAGIAPGSVPGFVAAQLVGLALGLALTLALYPDAGDSADDVVIPHGHDDTSTAASSAPTP